MDGYHTMTENAGSKISCQDGSLVKGFDMENKSIPGFVLLIAICCIGARFRKMAKRKEELRKESANSTYLSLLNDDITGCGLRFEITYPR